MKEILKQREDEEEEVKTKLGKANSKLQNLLAEKAKVLSSQEEFFKTIQSQLLVGCGRQTFKCLNDQSNITSQRLKPESEIAEMQLKIFK